MKMKNDALKFKNNKRCGNQMSTVLFLLTVLFVIFLLPLKTFASTINKPLYILGWENGLVGWWTMDGPDTISNITDRSTTGTNGSLTGQAATTTAPGKIGQALSLDGTDDFVNMGTSATYATSNMTISFWARSNTAPTIFDGPMGKTESDTWTQGWGFFFQSATQMRFFVEGYNTNFASNTFTNPVTNWNHYVGTWDGTTIKLYVNAVVGTNANYSGSITATNQFNIGRVGGTNNYNLNGQIDDVRFYNRALSASEVSALYKAGQSKQNISFGGPRGLESNLVGWWTMDGADTISNITDRSTGGNDGKLSGQAATTTAPGKIGQALYFDGSDDYVTAGDPSTLDFSTAQDFSFSIWFKPDTTTTGAIIGKGFGGSGPGYGSRVDTQASCWIANGTSASEPVGGTVLARQWNHVVCTRKGTLITVYLNGASVATSDTAINDDDLTNANSLCIGARAGTACTNQRFAGSLDDARVYSRALSASEVSALYNSSRLKQNVSSAGPGSLQNGLVGWWTMDGPDTISNVTDRSGQGNNGSLIGQAATTTAPGKIGQALSLDGTDDFVNMGSSATYATSNMTVSFWARSNVPPTIFDGPMGKTEGDSWTQGWGFFFQSATEIRFFVEGYATNVAAKTSIAPTNWTHYVGTWDGSTVQVYVNGVAGTSDSYSGSITATNQFNIGRVGGTNNYNLNGQIDDVRFYNRALSASEVTALYNLGR